MIMDGDRTLFDGRLPGAAGALPARHAASASRSIRYWDLNYPTADTPRRCVREAEHVERMREVLRESIRLRLRADVPVGCTCAAASTRARCSASRPTLRDDPVEAFTIAFEEGPFDEGPIAEEMAAHVGANFHRFRMPEEMLAHHYADADRRSAR